METFLNSILNFILHIDVHLASIVSTYGLWTYGILFLIIFCETGLVVTPFLPGDSLLFAIGALSSKGDLNIILLWILLMIAAVLGDTVNYWIGYFFGHRILESKKVPFVKHEHIEKTQHFYEKHGGKTIILARFIPLIRTFAPFVAGIGKMHYGRFFSYNVIGGVVWVSLLLWAGYFFSELPIVKDNFEIVIIGIVFVSVLPAVYEYYKHRRPAYNPSSRID